MQFALHQVSLQPGRMSLPHLAPCTARVHLVRNAILPSDLLTIIRDYFFIPCWLKVLCYPWDQLDSTAIIFLLLVSLYSLLDLLSVLTQNRIFVLFPMSVVWSTASQLVDSIAWSCFFGGWIPLYTQMARGPFLQLPRLTFGRFDSSI